MVAAAGPTSALKPAHRVGRSRRHPRLPRGVRRAVRSSLLTGNVPLESLRKCSSIAPRRLRARSAMPTRRRIGAYGFDAAGDYLRFARAAAGRGRDAGAAPKRQARRAAVLVSQQPAADGPGGGQRARLAQRPAARRSPTCGRSCSTATGRLVEFTSVPPQLDEPPPAAPRRPRTGRRFFELADLDITELKPATPLWTPRTYADERVAWEGPMPGWPEQQVRVEAGRVPRPARVPADGESVDAAEPHARRRRVPASQRIVQPFIAIVVLIVLGVAALVARHNLRKGRGDRRGALRIWAVIFVAIFGAWLLSAKHVIEVERRARAPLRRRSDGRCSAPARCGCCTWRSNRMSGSSGRRR